MPPTFTDEGVRAALVVRKQFPDISVLVLSQYVEENYATELVAGRSHGVGYLLKDRVADVGDFLEALRRVAAGGTALDPEVVSQLLSRSRRRDPLERLSPREIEVLQLMAEGRSNTAIAAALVVTEGAVEKHVSSIFAKLDLPPTEHDHRRVLAVCAGCGRTPMEEPEMTVTEPVTAPAPAEPQPPWVWALRIIGLAIAGVTLAFGALGVVSAFMHREHTTTREFTQPITRLVADTDNGDVRIRAGADGQPVQVTARVGESFDNARSSETVTDGVLRLTGRCWFILLPDNCGVSYTVTVPAGTVVQVTTGTGDAVVDGTSATITVDTGTGTSASATCGRPGSAPRPGPAPSGWSSPRRRRMWWRTAEPATWTSPCRTTAATTGSSPTPASATSPTTCRTTTAPPGASAPRPAPGRAAEDRNLIPPPCVIAAPEADHGRPRCPEAPVPS
jgi:DNA-binding NarL/FixJ family response regulator